MTVETEVNGRAALEMSEDRCDDLILSDLRMPELDGLGLNGALARRHCGLLRQRDAHDT